MKMWKSLRGLQQPSNNESVKGLQSLTEQACLLLSSVRQFSMLVTLNEIEIYSVVDSKSNNNQQSSEQAESRKFSKLCHVYIAKQSSAQKFNSTNFHDAIFLRFMFFKDKSCLVIITVARHPSRSRWKEWNKCF